MYRQRILAAHSRSVLFTYSVSSLVYLLISSYRSIDTYRSVHFSLSIFLYTHWITSIKKIDSRYKNHRDMQYNGYARYLVLLSNLCKKSTICISRTTLYRCNAEYICPKSVATTIPSVLWLPNVLRPKSCNHASRSVMAGIIRSAQRLTVEVYTCAWLGILCSVFVSVFFYSRELFEWLSLISLSLLYNYLVKELSIFYHSGYDLEGSTSRRLDKREHDTRELDNLDLFNNRKTHRFRTTDITNFNIPCHGGIGWTWNIYCKTVLSRILYSSRYEMSW